MTLATQDRHGLATPTVVELRTSLSRLVRADFDAFWTAACRQAAVSPTSDLPPSDLARLCRVVIDGGGIAAVGARGISVRLNSAALLNAK